ncbi:30S ribosomal protein S8e [Candidatus Woesearchaeota archaeon]|nr:MAG: 30S ribosomal protein S8e [Candidatus Woesearchaeota archaeon ex4484_78]RLE45265.1 MAG: 30S ribosomal protein S8e [Candidatus Woesearchaeota archaeon]
MVIVQKGRLKRKPSGGRYRQARSKRKYEIGRAPAHTKIGEQKIKTIRTKGGGKKTKVFGVKFANVLNPKDKKFYKVEIQGVVECPANRHFIRRNIVVKGAVISTKLGNAKVTSRPGQSGTVNAVLV